MEAQGISGSESRTNSKRPWFKKKRFIIPLAIILLAGIASSGDSVDEAAQTEDSGAASVSSDSNQDTDSNATDEVDSGDGQEVSSEEVEPKVSEPMQDEYLEGTFNILASSFDSESYPDFEIWIRGQGSWYPDLESGDSLESVGPFPIGESVEDSFYIYPFGRSGVEVPITLDLNDDHISDSARDLLLVSIQDGVLEVTGTPVETVQTPLS